MLFSLSDRILNVALSGVFFVRTRIKMLGDEEMGMQMQKCL